MRRFVITVLAGLCMAGTLMSQNPTPVPQAPALPAAVPARGPSSTSEKNADPRTIAAAPAGNPIRKLDIPIRADVSKDFEDWAAEISAGYWPFDPTGKVKTQSTPGDLATDLGVKGYKSHPYFRLIVKPMRRFALSMEGIPYRLNGATTLNRELVFLGRTFLVKDDVTTKIKLNSVTVQARYDVVSRNSGFVGLILGGGFLQANAKITNTSRGIQDISKAQAIFPMVGTGFRAYPMSTYRFSFDGEVKGMNLGNYGYYMQSAFGVGYSPSQQVTFHFGYSVLDSDVHNKYETEGLRANFRGPTISIQWRNR